MFELLNTITKVSEFATLPAAVVLIWRWRKLSSAQQFLGKFLLLITANQLFAIVWVNWISRNNLPLYHLYILLEGPALLWLFRWRFEQAFFRKCLAVTSIGLLLLTTVNALFIQGLQQLPTLSRTVESVLILALSIYYLRHVFVEQKVKYLAASFWFWLSSGLLIYFASNLLLFMFTNMLTNREDQLFLGVWSIHAVLNFFLYGFYSIAFLCQDKESSYSS